MSFKTKWWRRTPLESRSWHFWVDPYSEIRVVIWEHRDKPPSAPVYYFTNPRPDIATILTEKGWNRNADYFRANQDIASKTLEEMNLPLPDWNKTHCYRANWHDFTYNI